ncbi:hypothetical protein ACI79D_14025 [Geodermatophilus sp. SYSU D00708]
MGKAGKVVTTLVSTTGAGGALGAGIAYFGWPVLLGGGLVLLLALAWLSWVLGDKKRTNRLCKIIYGRKIE